MSAINIYNQAANHYGRKNQKPQAKIVQLKGGQEQNAKFPKNHQQVDMLHHAQKRVNKFRRITSFKNQYENHGMIHHGQFFPPNDHSVSPERPIDQHHYMKHSLVEQISQNQSGKEKKRLKQSRSPTKGQKRGQKNQDNENVSSLYNSNHRRQKSDLLMKDDIALDYFKQKQSRDQHLATYDGGGGNNQMINQQSQKHAPSEVPGALDTAIKYSSNTTQLSLVSVSTTQQKQMDIINNIYAKANSKKAQKNKSSHSNKNQSPMQNKINGNQGSSFSIEGLETTDFPDIMDNSYKIIHNSNKCQQAYSKKLNRFQAKQKANYLKQASDVVLERIKDEIFAEVIEYLIEDSTYPRDDSIPKGSQNENMQVPPPATLNKSRQSSPEIGQHLKSSEQDNMFSLATSSLNSYAIQQSQLQHQQLGKIKINTSNNLQSAQQKGANFSSQQSMYGHEANESIKNTNEINKNILIEQQMNKDLNSRGVQFAKHQPVKRFMTLRDRQKVLDAQDNQGSSNSDNLQVHFGANQHVGRQATHKIKRIKTQKGSASQEKGRGQTDESSANGMDLCKISESGLEELSIVQSDALYESEMPNEAIRQYDERIRQKMRDTSEFQIGVKPTEQPEENMLEFGSPYLKKQKPDKKIEKSSSPRLFARGNNPQLKNMQVNQKNNQNKLRIANVANNQNKNYEKEFTICNSSEYAKLGHSESQFSQHYKIQKDQIQKNIKRNGSYILSSNDGSSSFNVSVDRFQHSNFSSAHKQQYPHKQQISPIKTNENNKQLINRGTSYNSSQNAVNIEEKNSANDNNSSSASPLRMGRVIPKIPGLKRLNTRERIKNHGLSKELDQVVENDELDYSPMKSLQQNEIQTFESVAKNVKIALKNAKEPDDQILDITPQKALQAVSEENQRNDTGNNDIQSYKGQEDDQIYENQNLNQPPINIQQQSPAKSASIQIGSVYTDDNQVVHLEFDKETSPLIEDTEEISHQNASLNAHKAAVPSTMKQNAHLRQQSPSRIPDSNYINIKNQSMFVPNQRDVNNQLEKAYRPSTKHMKRGRHAQSSKKGNKPGGADDEGVAQSKHYRKNNQILTNMHINSSVNKQLNASSESQKKDYIIQKTSFDKNLQKMNRYFPLKQGKKVNKAAIKPNEESPQMPLKNMSKNQSLSSFHKSQEAASQENLYVAKFAKTGQIMARSKNQIAQVSDNPRERRYFDAGQTESNKFVCQPNIIIRKQITQPNKPSGKDLTARSITKSHHESEVNILKGSLPEERNSKSSQEYSRLTNKSKQLVLAASPADKYVYDVQTTTQNTQLSNAKKSQAGERPKIRSVKTKHDGTTSSGFQTTNSVESFGTGPLITPAQINSYMQIRENFKRNNMQNLKLKNQTAFEQIRNIYYQGNQSKYLNQQFDHLYSKFNGAQYQQNGQFYMMMPSIYAEAPERASQRGARKSVQAHRQITKDQAYVQYKNNTKLIQQKINNIDKGNFANKTEMTPQMLETSCFPNPNQPLQQPDAAYQEQNGSFHQNNNKRRQIPITAPRRERHNYTNQAAIMNQQSRYNQLQQQANAKIPHIINYNNRDMSEKVQQKKEQLVNAHGHDNNSIVITNKYKQVQPKPLQLSIMPQLRAKGSDQVIAAEQKDKIEFYQSPIINGRDIDQNQSQYTNMYSDSGYKQEEVKSSISSGNFRQSFPVGKGNVSSQFANDTNNNNPPNNTEQQKQQQNSMYSDGQSKLPLGQLKINSSKSAQKQQREYYADNLNDYNFQQSSAPYQQAQYSINNSTKSIGSNNNQNSKFISKNKMGAVMDQKGKKMVCIGGGGKALQNNSQSQPDDNVNKTPPAIKSASRGQGV